MTHAFTRRTFFKSSGLALLSLGFGASFLERAVAASPGARGKVLVVVFQRGGLDGLSVVAPYSDPAYQKARPTLALGAPGQGGGVLALDDHFGMHPSLAPLQPLWNDHALAFVHGVGLTHHTRSHFDAQDFVDNGTPGNKSTPDGWLNRTVAAMPPEPANAFRAVALQPTLPRSMMGNASALSLGSLSQFQIRAGGKGGEQAQGTFEGLYASAVDEALRSTGNETFSALHQMQSNKLAELPPQNGAQYGKDPLARRLQDIARLIHADVGLEVATTDVTGWDTHVQQGQAVGQLANRLGQFASALAAFAQDLGPKLADVCLLTVTEFGRTVHENGNRGTDHGTGSVMLALGGGVRGGRVLGEVPDLTEGNLFEGRDVPVSVDVRRVFSEALGHTLKVRDVRHVFPGFVPEKVGVFG